MKFFCTLLIATLISTLAAAQQPAQYSLYMLNPLGWNPAYAGIESSLNIVGVYRKQWTGLEGSPTTQNLSAHTPFYLLGGGVGINIENDELGAERWTSGTLAYSYQKELSAGVLSFGAGLGIVQRQLDGGKIRTPQGDYTEPGNHNHNDPILPLGLESAITPTFHAGAYFTNERMEAGVSVRNINEGKAELGNLSLTLKRNFNVNVGFHFDLGRSFSVHPSAFLRSDLTQTQVDFSVIMRYNDNIFGGASFRGYNTNSRDAVAILAGFKLSEKFTLAYAYDLTLSDLSTVSNGSHEIVLSFSTPISGKGKLPPIIYNPRSL
ncbi:MAG: type IX secretion system membrane protein PorP/SprF [Saprospiraceae bacterium]|nr:type IX secretion system membrane protein PorP/SprF [Saprospiraceae bacterium]